jgi:hypothetical protein
LLAIVWIYNLIWFVPLDFIKFGLQAVFNRTLHAVKPFERIHNHMIASRRAKRAIMPSETIDKIIDDHPGYSRQLSQQEQQLEVKTTCMPTTFDQVTQTGSSFYSPYTETLSFLRKQNPLLKSVSLN